MALFDDKEKKAIKTGIAHCNACGQLLSALRQMGAPNETLEQQNSVNQKILETALKLDADHDTKSKGA